MNIALILGHQPPFRLPKERRKHLMDGSRTAAPHTDSAPDEDPEARRAATLQVMRPSGPLLAAEIAETVERSLRVVTGDLGLMRQHGLVDARKVGKHTIWWVK